MSLASSVCLDVRESISNAEMCDSFEIMHPAGEKRERCKDSVEELEARRQESVFLC